MQRSLRLAAKKAAVRSSGDDAIRVLWAQEGGRIESPHSHPEPGDQVTALSERRRRLIGLGRPLEREAHCFPNRDPGPPAGERAMAIDHAQPAATERVG